MTGRKVLGASKTGMWQWRQGIRGDMEWRTFRERIAKAVLRYRLRLQKMDESKWTKKMCEWNMYAQ